MLTIIKSGLNAGARDRFKGMIRTLIEAEQPSYLIVPEQQTVMAEAEMSREMPPTAPQFFEVTNFTRLANTTFRTLGGISGEYSTKTKKALIMWRTLTELTPVLSMTEGRREINSGLVERALSAITDMQVLGIDEDSLREFTSNEVLAFDKRLSSKISDLSKIYTLYRSLLLEKYSDNADDVAVMNEKLEKNPEFLAGHEIFIEGFTSFTAPQLALISTLIKRCEVTVILAIPRSADGAFEYTELIETEEKLKALSRRAGVEIKRFSEENKRPQRSDELYEISALLFRNNIKYDNLNLQNALDLRIFESPTPFDMCDFVASDIRRRVMDGARYSDFAIVARDVDRYLGVLDTALSRAGVEAFVSQRSDVSSFEAIKLIYTAYAAVRSGFAREDVMSYAKCGLSGIEREACDELELYVDTWQISGRRFVDGLTWNMNPRGYSTTRAEGVGEKLLRINETRERLIAPLVKFSEGVKEAKTVHEHARVLIDFLLSIDLESSLADKAERLLSYGENAYAESNARLWKLICDSLDELVEVSGDMAADADAFLGQLKILFSSASIGRIPAHTDEVTVGSADMLRLYGKKHVYMIGVNAGEFPAPATDSAYFSERDRIFLSELGLGVKPELEVRSSKELYFFSRAFSYASESVTLLYSARDSAFKAAQRSDVIDKIIKLTGGTIKPVRTDTLSAKDAIWSASYAMEHRENRSAAEARAVREALRKSGHAREVDISERSITNTDMALGQDICNAERERTLSLTQSRLDAFRSCPLSHFCKYTLKLSDSARAEFDAAGIGSFIHSILENFFKTVKEKELNISDLTSADKESMTRAAAEKYVSSLADELALSPAGVRVKINRLCRAAMPVVDGICEEFSVSRFEPAFFELSLGDENGPGKINIDSATAGNINIYGIVDRVDTYERDGDVFVRVVDYKTGSKVFSPEDMAEGKNLQMFLYLDAIVNSENKKFLDKLGATGRILPAGVTYLKSSVSDVRVSLPDDEEATRAVKDGQKREGMVLDDEDVIDAMGLEYTPLYSKRTPTEIPEANRKYLYDEDGFDEIIETVHSSVEKIAEGIRSGDASATPDIPEGGVSSCEYCDFKPICRKAILK